MDLSCLCAFVPVRRCLFAALALFWLSEGSSLAQQLRSTGEMIVRFRANSDQKALARITGAARLRPGRLIRTRAMQRSDHPGLHVVHSDLPLEEALAVLRKDPSVEFAEPNRLLTTSATSNDPVFTSGNLWGMYGNLSSPSNPYGSQAAEAWSAGYTGSSSVYVAVIDDGMQITHPDLAPNVWVNPFDPPDGIDNDGNGCVDDTNGWNSVAHNNVIFEGDNNHGTHVAGIIGARGGNGTGVAGVNWNVTLIPVKFMTNGVGPTTAAIEAIDYCIDLKTRHTLNLVAINASWGGPGYSAALHEAVIRAAKAGILFIAAAGNDSADNDAVDTSPANLTSAFGTLSESPAGYNNVISVAAIDSSGALAPFSNYGSTKVHIGAPGVLIYSTYPTNLIGGLDGTSMAAPHVTGAVALYASTHPSATPSQIRAAILNAASPTPSLTARTSSGGRLNLSTIVAPAPALAAVTAELLSETWPNGAFEPGETVTVQLTVTNSTPVPTGNLIGFLSAGGGVVSPGSSQTFGTLVGGGPAAGRSFTFVVGGACGETISLVLALRDGPSDLGSVVFPITLGAGTNLFVENFDSVAPPGLPPGWTPLLSGSGASWKTSAGVSSSGPNAAFAPNPNGSADNSLTSPALQIHSGSARLSFRHDFSLEEGWDGGVLEISIGGGNFTDILSAGGTFIENGYNMRLSSSTIPLASRPAWSGSSGGFIATSVQLPAACLNQEVRLRWRCGSDSSFGGNGWYVDSIALVDGYTCGLPPQILGEDQSATNVFSIASESALALSASSTDSLLLPPESGVFSGTGLSRALVFTPGPNQFGTGTLTVKVQSDLATTYRTLNVLVNPVNDPPSFLAGGDVTVAQDSGAQSFANWATSVIPGPVNELGQNVSFSVSLESNASLFSVPPAIAADGRLTFTPAPHRRGTASLLVTLEDDGGRDLGGRDQSAPARFTITIGQGLDSDADGLPDDFETAFSLDPDSAFDGELDWDGDGLTNYEEFLAQTDPSQARSALRLSAVSAGDFQFGSIPEKIYALEVNKNFPAGAWEAVGGATAGTGSPIIGSDTNAAGDLRRIYRVSTTGENGSPVHSGCSGFSRLTLLGNSDTRVSAPFTRDPAELGAVLSVNANQIRFRNAPGWNGNRWVYSAGSQTNTYYLLFRSGASEGDYFTITNNSEDSVTVEADAAELQAVGAGDAVAIIPYWTLGTFFPGGEAVHSSPSSGTRETEVLFPNLQGNGINLSSVGTYYYFNNAWRKIGLGGAIKNDDVILPDMYITVRHSVPIDTVLTIHGSVMENKIRIPIRRIPTAKQDNSIALCRPMSVSLTDSGLLESGAFRSSASPADRIDELLIFDNSSHSQNKSATATYYYWNGAWRRIGAGGANVGSDLIFTPGSGVVLRSGAGTSTAWQNLPGY